MLTMCHIFTQQPTINARFRILRAPNTPDMKLKERTTTAQFFSADIRVGTVIEALPYPEAHKPAIKLRIDFGDAGILQSSAQLTYHYTPAVLVGRQVVAVVNFPPRQIGRFVSECLVLGATGDFGAVVLLCPDRPVPNGWPIS